MTKICPASVFKVVSGETWDTDSASMRLVFLMVVMLLVSLTRTAYIPHPKDPNVLIPIKVDPTKPRVRLQKVLVEEPPNPNRIYELLYLIFAVPLLFSGRNGGFFRNNGNGNGNGNGGVITEDPCC